MKTSYKCSDFIPLFDFQLIYQNFVFFFVRRIFLSFFFQFTLPQFRFNTIPISVQIKFQIGKVLWAASFDSNRKNISVNSNSSKREQQTIYTCWSFHGCSSTKPPARIRNTLRSLPPSHSHIIHYSLFRLRSSITHRNGVSVLVLMLPLLSLRFRGSFVMLCCHVNGVCMPVLAAVFLLSFGFSPRCVLSGCRLFCANPQIKPYQRRNVKR